MHLLQAAHQSSVLIPTRVTFKVAISYLRKRQGASFRSAETLTPKIRWRRGKKRPPRLSESRKKADRSPAEETLLAHLQSDASTFRAFKYAYETGKQPPLDDQRIPFSGAVAGTALDPKEHSGHVAIVEVKGGSEKNVIEAVSKGVIRTLLSSWLNQRKKERIWHMRHRAPALKRNQIALAAGNYIDLPYSLGKTRASYSLVDVRDFYCSKLVWLAIDQSIGVPIDDNPNTDRIWPLSPLVVFNSQHLFPVVDQGSYQWC